MGREVSYRFLGLGKTSLRVCKLFRGPGAANRFLFALADRQHPGALSFGFLNARIRDVEAGLTIAATVWNLSKGSHHQVPKRSLLGRTDIRGIANGAHITLAFETRNSHFLFKG
jgi:hypothetical protein